MKRRSFVQAMLAGLAATSLPVDLLAAPAPSATTWNAATLAAEMEKMFAAQEGPPMAFFYWDSARRQLTAPTYVESMQDPLYPNKLVPGYLPAPEGSARLDYESYVLGLEGGTAEEAEARLAKHFYDEFAKLPVGQLVWRVKPSFATQEMVEFGETYLTRSQVEDRMVKAVMGGQVVDVTYDVAGLPIVPSNVELDFMSDSYKVVKRKYQLHKLRMRIALPHLYDEEVPAVQSLYKPEGSGIKRMA